MKLPKNYRAITLASGIHVAARATPDKIAVREGSGQLTYAALSTRIRTLAAKLVECGLSRGDRVAVLAPNCLEYPELVCGIADAGLIAVTLNARAPEREIAEVLRDSRARLLLIHPSLDHLVPASNDSLFEHRIAIDDNYRSWRVSASESTVLPAVSEFDPFVLVYTSGTTGRPKGVLLPHRARTLLFYGKSIEYGCYGREDRHLAVCPMSSGGGFGFSMCALFFGGFLEIMPKFDAARVVEKLASEAFTGTFVVPSHLHAIFDLDPAFLLRHRRAAKHLKSLICNAAALPPGLKAKSIEYWGDNVLHETYGFTEAGVVTNLRPAAEVERPASVGRAFPLCDVRLIDAKGSDVVQGEVGELFVSSPYLFNGYFERPQEDAEWMVDRWVSAGDLARQDADGYFYIVDRKKDMVISGGFNIYPREIEDLLLQHEAIADCAVIGVPHERWGESLRAYVVLARGKHVLPDQIQAFCRGKLSDYKLPREFEFVKELPRNSNGKVLKRILRDHYLEQLNV